APPKLVQEIRGANTARHVFEIVTKNNLVGYFDLVCKKVHEQMREHAREQLEIEVVMFDFDGKVTGRYPV
ncbi:MAG: cobalt-precorrin-5B (C(1))-methyltransferase, partial [Thaumarchaeota archaeon]